MFSILLHALYENSFLKYITEIFTINIKILHCGLVLSTSLIAQLSHLFLVYITFYVLYVHIFFPSFKFLFLETFYLQQSWAIVSTIDHYLSTFLLSLPLSIIYKMPIVIDSREIDLN